MISIEAKALEQRAEAFRNLGLPAEAVDSISSNTEGNEHAVLAFSRDALPAASAIRGIERRERPVVLGQLEPGELIQFEPIAPVELPDVDAYLLLDVDLGAETRNVRPEDALRGLLERGRSPLTMEEGIALMIQQPEAIAKNWGFSMAGSRRGDQRVPAFWVSEGRPKLGWCWDRNPHTWLGTASCAHRVPV